MTHSRRGHSARMLAAAIGLVLLLAACGPAEATPAPRVGCPAEVLPSPPPRPWNDDPALVQRIPDEIDGEALAVETVCATAIGARGLPTSPGLLQDLGVELQDVTIAQTPSAFIERTGIGITAWRYAGADENALRAAVLAAFEGAGIPAEEETIAGKAVYRALLHVYHVADDTLYAVVGPDARVEEIIEALP
jgi:hypothetical protein